jgi:hypothetical protein
MVVVGGKSPHDVLDAFPAGPSVTAVGRLLPAVAAWLPSDQSPLSSDATGPQRLLQGLLLAFDHLLDNRSHLAGTGVRDEGSAAYASRYDRARPAATFAHMQPQDLELLSRLRDIPAARGLINTSEAGQTVGCL